MEFDEEITRFNIYDSMRYPTDIPTAILVDVLDLLVQSFAATNNKDHVKFAIEESLTPQQVKALEENMVVDISISESVFELEALSSLPLNLAFIELQQTHAKLLTSILQAPVLELKELPNHLKYAFLGENNTLPVIISSKLTPLEEEKLVRVLREFREAISWTITDIKGLSPSTCMRRILLEERTKPSREAQCRLNPPIIEVVSIKFQSTPLIKIRQHSLVPLGLLPIEECLLACAMHPPPFKDDFSKIAQPLCALLQKDANFEFDDACAKAFDKLKESLTSALVIRPPDWNQSFEIMCDASNHAIGAVLGQKIEKDPHVIYYASRMLDNTQTLRYLMSKKEAKPRLIRRPTLTSPTLSLYKIDQPTLPLSEHSHRTTTLRPPARCQPLPCSATTPHRENPAAAHDTPLTIRAMLRRPPSTAQSRRPLPPPRNKPPAATLFQPQQQQRHLTVAVI
ncbi:UNVERIFIED_CONTAM: hypothetical protein Slati_3502800 [Sesamum latifolium]|uniref:Reverse transcriptase/retrotransposon-derived protein RNase H-like domain-containing protein n=1 Tax=Sesamum latifolium TaxID=2727402 RepID=A0AAW2UHC3_9LAMI